MPNPSMLQRIQDNLAKRRKLEEDLKRMFDEMRDTIDVMEKANMRIKLQQCSTNLFVVDCWKEPYLSIGTIRVELHRDHLMIHDGTSKSENYTSTAKAETYFINKIAELLHA